MVFPVEIRTPKLTIRELRAADSALIFDMTSDPDVVRYLSFGPASPAEARALVDYAAVAAARLPRQEYVLAIDGQRGEFVGACGFHTAPELPGARELFFVIRKALWGQGLATEAVASLISFGFGELGLSKIFGVAHPENRASIRVMERAGMAFDGEERDAFADGEGWRAGVRYAILRP